MLLLRIVFPALLLALAAPTLAREYVGRTPPRLSLVEGQVSFWPNGGQAWEQAELNLPLAPGDFLSSGAGSRVEVQVGPRAFLRLAADSQVGFDEQQEDYLRLEVVDGRIALDVRQLPAGARVHVRTAHATLAFYDPGFYEVVVAGDRTSFLAHRNGSGTVFVDSDFDTLRSGEEVVRRTGGRFEHYEAPQLDAFARWNLERTDAILTRIRNDYVPEDVYGLDELEQHGTWSEEPEYGRVWVPRHVASNWAPYTTGRWYWDVGYGWTWIDSAPWGWAPYHYGRWVRLHSRWGWAPGPRYGRSIYSPALVAFLYEPGITIGIGGPVSWVALGWGEPVLPWWGPTWYRGRPCWDGWGGPTYFNHHRVDRHHKYDHHDIPRYRHQDTPDAVVVVDRRDFGRRNTTRPQQPRVNRDRLRAVEQPPVQPRDVGVPERRERTRPPRAERGPGTRPQETRQVRPANGQGGRETEPRRVDRTTPSRGTVPGPRYDRGESQPTRPQQFERAAPVARERDARRPSPYDRSDRRESARPMDIRDERSPSRSDPRRIESVPAPPQRPVPQQRDTAPRSDPYGRQRSETRPQPRLEDQLRREPEVSRPQVAPRREPATVQSAPRPARVERQARPERHDPSPAMRERPSRPQESMRPSRDSRDSDSDSDGGGMRQAPRMQPRGGGSGRSMPQRIEPPGS